MDRSSWKQFLKRWTEDWLAGNPSFAAELPNGWAGRPPATEEQLAAAGGQAGGTAPALLPRVPPGVQRLGLHHQLRRGDPRHRRPGVAARPGPHVGRGL